MTIAFVQSVDFSSSTAITSYTPNLNGVVAGNFLIYGVGIYHTATHSDSWNSPDSNGNTWQGATRPTTFNNMHCDIGYAMNVASGNTTVTVDQNGDAFYAVASLVEFSGLVTSNALDVEASNAANSATPDSGTTAATAQADELAMAVMVNDDLNQSNLGIDLPSGYTNLVVHQNGLNDLCGSVDYRILSATGTQNASWGTTVDANNWQGKIATFKAAAAAGVTPSIAWIKA